MSKRSIGIEIGSRWIRAVEMIQHRNGFTIENLVSHPLRRSTDTLAEVLQELYSHHGFARRAPVAWALPASEVFTRRQTIPPSESEENISEINDCFPIAGTNTQAAAVSPATDESPSCPPITAAAHTRPRDEFLRAAEKAEMPCALAEAPAFAVLAAVQANYPESRTESGLVIHLDQGRLLIVVLQKGHPALLRTLCWGSQEPEPTIQSLCLEVQLSWRAVFFDTMPTQVPVYLSGQAAADPTLMACFGDQLAGQIQEVDPFAQIKCSPEHDQEYNAVVAVGLALRQLQQEETNGLNFIGDMTQRKTIVCWGPLQKAATTMVLLGALLIGYLLSQVLYCHHLEKQNHSLEAQAAAVFRQVLPDETNLVNPVAQMQEHVSQLQRKLAPWQGSSEHNLLPLLLWQEVGASTFSDWDIELDALEIGNSELRLRASCPSFEIAYAWRDRLAQSSMLTSVELSNPRRHSETGRVVLQIVAHITERKDAL